MRIDSSVMGMQSSRKYVSVTARSVAGSTMRRTGSMNSSLGGFFGSLVSTGDDTEQTGGNEKNTANLGDITTHFKNLSNTGRVSGTERRQDPVMTIRQQCVRFLMDLFFRFRGENVSEQEILGTPNDFGMNGGTTVYQVNTFTNEYYHMEEEHTTFATQGMVKTADGRELSFNLEFSMSRRFEEYYKETYTTEVVKFCDPLVINLDTNVAQVSDPIWEKLLIWTKDENGDDKLYHLSDLGVGAIGLGKVSTQFALNSEKDNHSNAMIRSTGIFLYESGMVSTVQHLDLAR